jgi:hypothetical protein
LFAVWCFTDAIVHRPVPTGLGGLTKLAELFLHSNSFIGVEQAEKALKQALPSCYTSV